MLRGVIQVEKEILVMWQREEMGKRRELVHKWKVWPYVEVRIGPSSFVNIPC